MQINNYDGTPLTTIPDGHLDTTTSLFLPGHNTTNYGIYLNENLVALLESFAGNTAPQGTNQQGQLWFNKNNQTLNVFTNQGYVPVSGIIVSGIEPSNPNPGNTWFNTSTNQYNLYDGTNWNLIGPTYTKAQGISGAIPVAVGDANVAGITHNIIQIQYGNYILAIFNSDSAFVPSPSITGFPIINSGITLSTGITNASFNSNVVGTLTGNVIGSLSGARVSATTLVGSLIGPVTGNVTASSVIATNLSTANAVIAGGSVNGLTTLATTTGTATNFSTGNALITAAGITTGVITNFSTANAQITGGNLTGDVTVQGTTGQFTNFSTGNAIIAGGSANGLTTLSASTATLGNISTGNIQIINESVTTSVITNLSTGNARISGGNITVANVITGPLTATVITANTATFSGNITAVSPVFTGVPVAPTATSGANTTQIATTAFVTSAVSGLSGSLGTMAAQNSNSVNISGGLITGTYGLRANSAASADSATIAGHASVADLATLATNATHATSADSATNATHASTADSATYATTAGNGGVTSVNGGSGAVTVRGLGIGGETWHNVSRSFNTQYTNPYTYPIAVSATATCSVTSTIQAYVNGQLIQWFQWQFNGCGSYGGAFIIVPPGATYQLNSGQGVYNWVELY